MLPCCDGEIKLYIIQLEALGQCILPPRHVLPVLRYGSRSMNQIATKI